MSEVGKRVARVGIYSGVFDPVHDGHIKFALEAVKQAKLDKLYFLIEITPRRKVHVTHLAHRIAMLKLAIAKHPQLKFLELPDKQMSVAKTLPRLKRLFPNDELFYVIGADVLEHMPEWPLVDKLVESVSLIVGLREGYSQQKVDKMVNTLSDKPEILVIKGPIAKASSAQIRERLLSGKPTKYLNPAVSEYIRTNWLYASPSNSNSSS